MQKKKLWRSQTIFKCWNISRSVNKFVKKKSNCKIVSLSGDIKSYKCQNFHNFEYRGTGMDWRIKSMSKVMKPKRGSRPKCAEEKPLRPLKEERPLRSFNSQVAREEFSDVWNAETDSDDELSSWDEDVEYRSCKYTRSFWWGIQLQLLRYYQTLVRSHKKYTQVLEFSQVWEYSQLFKFLALVAAMKKLSKINILKSVLFSNISQEMSWVENFLENL